jgi:hypothetical protein
MVETVRLPDECWSTTKFKPGRILFEVSTRPFTFVGAQRTNLRGDGIQLDERNAADRIGAAIRPSRLDPLSCDDAGGQESGKDPDSERDRPVSRPPSTQVSRRRTQHPRDPLSRQAKLGKRRAEFDRGRIDCLDVMLHRRNLPDSQTDSEQTANSVWMPRRSTEVTNADSRDHWTDHAQA